MRALKICLWVAGILCLSSIVGVFLPMSMCEAMVEYFGIESLPDSPLFFYMARVTSAMAVWIGVFFIILALSPMKYGVLVPFSGLAAVFLGVVCAITGMVVGMPPLWFLGDSLSCYVLGILIVVFWRLSKTDN